MKKIYILLVAIGVLAYGRGNPFVSTSSNSEQSTQTSNVLNQYKDFDKKEIKLSDQARVLKYVAVGYQILDGSIEEKKVLIDKRVDWHDPLILMANRPKPKVAEQKQKAPAKAVTVTKVADAPKKDIADEAKKLIPKEDKTVVLEAENRPVEKKLKKKKLHARGLLIQAKQLQQPTFSQEKYEVLKSYKLNYLFSFGVGKRYLVMHPKGELIRDFVMRDPYRLVFDFKKRNSFYTKSKRLSIEPFAKARIGSHDSYYRVVFTLDGASPYKITRHTSSEIIVKLR